MERYLRVLTKDEPEALLKLSSLICRRGYEVESLNCGPGSVDGSYLFNIVLKDNGKDIMQIIKQIKKLVEVIEAGSAATEPIAV